MTMRLLAGDFRGEVEASRARMAAVVAVLNHPGHDQKSHGRKGSGGNTDLARRERAVSDAAASRVVSSRELGGGSTDATTRLEEHEGGTIVTKDFDDTHGYAADQVDAEVLGSKVAAAIGVAAPAVVQTSDTAIAMEHIPGKTGQDIYGEGGPPTAVVDSDQGRLMGVLDIVIANGDRHPGNTVIGDDGTITAIDHSLSFDDLGDSALDWDTGTNSPFASHFVTRPEWSNELTKNDMSPGDMAIIRTRLRALGPDFRAAGRQEWFDGMMARVDALAANATGERSRLP
ncbi:MAG TPA: hypothetical protein VF174_08885 [Micromonosporaceae bacterium]